MTQNQIAYWRLQEDKRANQTKEEETNRHNVATETHATSQLAEDIRHNQASEKHNTNVLFETNRHNVATEKDAANKTAETIRHNINSESIDIAKLNETNRHNEAMEDVEHQKYSESVRSNQANEGIKKDANYIAKQNADSQRLQAEVADRGMLIKESESVPALAHKAFGTNSTEANLLSTIYSGALDLASIFKLISTK